MVERRDGTDPGLISILMLNHYCRHVVGEVSAVEMIEHTAIVALYLAGGVP